MNAFIQFVQETIFPLAILFYVAGMIVLMVLSYRPPRQDGPADRTPGTTAPHEYPRQPQSPYQPRSSLPARQTLRITGCCDSSLWYHKHLWKEFDVFRQEYWPNEDMIVYWVRTPEGTTNWVNDRDCVVTTHPLTKE